MKGIVNKKQITQEEFESIIGSEQVTGLLLTDNIRHATIKM
ncbi:hypothetical protein [Clostridium gasigenes]|uniref:Uncharacterized protein n=1 Tax=Clostridium gasigenes TaxID=94869 RepID=A0A1H0M989_9CLOT|nr:hypothetical protein [Clostridium gasigenes]SDO76861.1 hypothetical protein SAMN04488529_101367 [Clostridium gasigenes]